MSKFLVRITIIGVASYLIFCYTLAVFFNLDAWSQSYYLLFELCVCLCISKQGVYHCKFVKWTAYGILASDTIVCLDNAFDIFPVNFMVFAPAIIIALGLLTTITLAIRHFMKVKKYKRRWENPKRRF